MGYEQKEAGASLPMSDRGTSPRGGQPFSREGQVSSFQGHSSKGGTSEKRWLGGPDPFCTRRKHLVDALRKSRRMPVMEKVMRIVGPTRWQSLSWEEKRTWLEAHAARRLQLQTSLKKAWLDLQDQLISTSEPSKKMQDAFVALQSLEDSLTRHGLASTSRTSTSDVAPSEPKTQESQGTVFGEGVHVFGKGHMDRRRTLRTFSGSVALGGVLARETHVSEVQGLSEWGTVGTDGSKTYGWVEQAWLGQLMRAGHRARAERIHRLVLAHLSEVDSSVDPRTLFMQALDRARPYLEVKPIRLGGVTYRVPVDMPLERQYTCVLRWLAHHARGHVDQEGTTVRVLVTELTALVKGSGSSILLQKRDDLHKVAAANREFAHYRWNP